MKFSSLTSRLSVNKQLLEACFGCELKKIERALQAGADPNQEIFHKVWRERTGTRFAVKQWWGGRRDEPIYGSTLDNYWTTPLSVIVNKSYGEALELLLNAGANPWALGCGSEGWARPSPMSDIFHKPSERANLIKVLDRHFDHVVACYPESSPPAAHNNLDRFMELATGPKGSKEAAQFLAKLSAHLVARNLQQDTSPAQPLRSSLRPRF